jgi:DDE superfamily endonuclease
MAIEGIMGWERDSVKKCVVKLSGASPARRLLKARILLKADVYERGPGWSDSKIIAALDTPLAKMIVLIQDNLNVHSNASLYEAFPAAEARRFVERFEWHYTPKHGSWLNVAESLGILAAQCLDRHIHDKQTLIGEIAAWEHDRNAQRRLRLAFHREGRAH